MTWGWALLLVEWAVRIGAVPLVGRRHTPHAAAAWLAVIFAVPLPGLLLYWFVGTERLPRRRIQRRAGVPRTRGMGLARVAPHAVALLEPAERHVLALRSDLSDFPLVGGNAVHLIDGAAAFIDQLVADIDGAQDHVHLLFYIYEDDAVGRRVADALARAAARGVVCRLLLDDTGSANFLRRRAEGYRAQGLQIAASLPVNLWRFFLARIDLRNHRKIAVVDGHIGYTGSANIVDARYGHKDLEWLDAMVRLTGPGVHQLQQVFLEDWWHDAGESLADPRWMPPLTAPPGPDRVQAVPSGPSEPMEAFPQLILAALHGARHRVVLTTPYFVPDEPILVALQMAAARGVQVDLVVPRRTDHRVVGAAGRAYFQPLLDAGVHVWRHHSAILHTKSLTVDDTFAVFGSGNLDVRSLYLNYELSLLMPGRDITERVRTLQTAYMQDCEPLNAERWRARPFWRWAPEQAAKLLSPIL